MVYMSGTKAARNQSSLVNRANCGGVKKAGLAPSVGAIFPANISGFRMNNTQFGQVCLGNFSNPSQSALRAIRR